MQEDVRIYLTGACRIERGENVLEPRALAADPARIVFAFLVCERGREVANTELASALWGEALPAGWDETIEGAVQRVRRALAKAIPDASLRSVGTRYELKLPGRTWVDTEAAVDALHDAEGLLRTGHFGDAFGPSGVAHHVSKRPFLPGGEGPWVDGQRRRLRDTFLRALECRAEVFFSNGEYATAVDAAKEAIRQEPLRETAHRVLMRAHAASGNIAEAVRAYHHCRDLLRAGPGVDPSLQTRELYESITADKPVTRTERPPVGDRARTADAPHAEVTDAREHLMRALGDSYAIGRELQGGMSRVFMAEERALGRRVVIKVLPPDLAAVMSSERFAREVKLAARLQQANIVPVLTAGVAGDLPYYTMPYVAGESLRALLGEHPGGIDMRRVVSVLRDVARALAYAHGEGVVHRDIKPENVLMSGHTAVVTDFGIAKALKLAEDTAADAKTAVTRTGISVGTPQYMAPEQAAGDPTIDHRADIYSYGVLAYELLTGRPPFAGRTSGELLVAHFFEVPTDVSEIRRDTPRQMAAMVMRCLEKKAEDRPQSVVDLMNELP